MQSQIIQQTNKAFWVIHHGHKLVTFGKTVMGIDPDTEHFSMTIATYFNIFCFTCGRMAMAIWEFNIDRERGKIYESEPWCRGHHIAYHPEYCIHCFRKNIKKCGNLNCPTHNMPFPLKPEPTFKFKNGWVSIHPMRYNYE